MCDEKNAHKPETTTIAAPATHTTENNDELVLSDYGKVMENEQAVLYQYRGHAGAAALARLIR